MISCKGNDVEAAGPEDLLLYEFAVILNGLLQHGMTKEKLAVVFDQIAISNAGVFNEAVKDPPSNAASIINDYLSRRTTS